MTFSCEKVGVELFDTAPTRYQASQEASEMAARERANPSDSLTSVLLEAEVDGRKLADMELTLLFMFLIVAGNETTRTATSHGLLTLLDHPESLEHQPASTRRPRHADRPGLGDSSRLPPDARRCAGDRASLARCAGVRSFGAVRLRSRQYSPEPVDGVVRRGSQRMGALLLTASAGVRIPLG